MFDFESLVLRKFRKITAISHPCACASFRDSVENRSMKMTIAI